MNDYYGRLWGGNHWPVIQRYPLQFAAGASQEIRFNRPHPVNLYVTVQQGEAYVNLSPDTPGVDPPDFIFSPNGPVSPITFGPGDNRITVYAAGSKRLICKVIVMRSF